MQQIISRIIDLAKENNITGKELGEKLGLKKTPLTDWKNQKAKPTLEQIIMLCEIFGVSANYMIYGQDNNEITEDDYKILTAYKNATEGTKECVNKLLDISLDKGNGKSSITKIG